MKKGALILLLGLFACLGAFAGFYYLGTASNRSLAQQPDPELAWLKKEFHLSDAEFARIVKMHEDYLPHCRERCLKIGEQNRRLEQLLANSTNMTSEIQDILAERARLRGECEAEMMKHFLQVSQTMPPEQGRRYLAWVEENVFGRGQGMEQRHGTETDGHSMSGHHGM